MQIIFIIEKVKSDMVRKLILLTSENYIKIVVNTAIRLTYELKYFINIYVFVC